MRYGDALIALGGLWSISGVITLIMYFLQGDVSLAVAAALYISASGVFFRSGMRINRLEAKKPKKKKS